MEEAIKKLNEILPEFGLKCLGTGGAGQKLSFVQLEDDSCGFALTLTWHNKVIIESFQGCKDAEDFCKLLTKLTHEIEKLNL